MAENMTSLPLEIFDEDTPPTETAEITNILGLDLPWQPNIRCLRGNFAPLESCPNDAPPGVVAHLECDENCGQRMIESAPQTEVEEIKPAPVPKVLKAAA